MNRPSPSPRVFAAVVLALAVPASSVAGQQSAPRARTSVTPTFYEDVLPVLQENCQICHQPQGRNMGGLVAPMSLVTYEDTRAWAPMIAEAVRSGTMPPWSAAAMHKGTFENERILEDSEKDLLLAWVDGGTPAGDPAAAPRPPEFLGMAAQSGGWSLGEPDLILSFAEPFCMNDDDRDIYVDIPVQITADMLPEDRWIQSIEYRNGPGVHHIISSVGSLVPGGAPQIWEEGYGRVMRAGPREVEFQMHFNKAAGPGTALCSNIQAGIRFKPDGEVIRHVTGGDALYILPLTIPAGESSFSASREFTFEEDVELLSFLPHMHLRGKAALYEVTYPDGGHEILLHVPDYDFNWQHTYQFADPPRIPAGSVLRFTLWWDNSAENPSNPDPTVDVPWGRPTHLEMSQGYMSYRTLEERHIVVGQAVPAGLGTNPD